MPKKSTGKPSKAEMKWAKGDVETHQLEAARAAAFGELAKELGTGKRAGRFTPDRPTIGRGGFARVAKKLRGFVADEPSRTKARTVDSKPHDPRAGLGIVGCVELVAGHQRSPGLLVMRVNGAEDLGVDLATVRVFRWRKDVKQYQLVEHSGIAGTAYAWAMVASAGQYIAAGLPIDRGLRGVFAALAGLQPLKGLEDKQALEVRGRLYDVTFENRAKAGPKRRDKQRAKVMALRPEFIETSLTAVDGSFADYWRRQTWESVGPQTISGPIVDFAVCPGLDTFLYAVSSGGGVWRTSEIRDSHGLTASVDAWTGWEPILEDRPQPWAIGVDERRPLEIYAAVSEGTIIRSDSGGVNWSRISDRNFGIVRRILVHPRDGETVWLASETGLHQSTNGGRTWAGPPLLTGDITDAVLDRDDPRILYAAVRNSGVWKTQGGRWDRILEWSRTSNPTSTMIKIAIGRQGDPAHRTVLAKLAQEIFVHRASGEPGAGDWVSRGILAVPGNASDGQGDWNHVVAVDPFDNDRWLAGQQDLQLTASGGRHWIQVAGYGTQVHADQQKVVFDPVQRGRVYSTNDGGVWVSSDGGSTWNDYNAGLATTAMYQVGFNGAAAVAGTYHWGILATHSLGEEWEPTDGGSWEFTRQVGDPTLPDRFYVLGGGPVLYKYPRGRLREIIGNYGSSGAMCLLADWRPSFMAMLVATPDGAVMRTLDRDLDHPTWTRENGINLDTGAHDIIVSFAAAPRTSDPTMIALPFWVYAVSALGRVFYKSDIARDNDWTERGQWHATIGVSRDFRGTLGAHIAVNAVHPDHVYLISQDSFARSTTGGRDWEVANGNGTYRITGDTRSLCAHPSDGRSLYVVSVGDIHVSHDEGDSWASLRGNLPYVQADYLEARDGYLYVSTYGRGVWRRRI